MHDTRTSGSRQTYSNIEFFVCNEALKHLVKHQVRLNVNSISWFQRLIIFKIGTHYIGIQLQRDREHQRLATQYVLTEHDLETFINDWPQEWR